MAPGSTYHIYVRILNAVENTCLYLSLSLPISLSIYKFMQKSKREREREREREGYIYIYIYIYIYTHTYLMIKCTWTYRNSYENKFLSHPNIFLSDSPAISSFFPISNLS